MPGKEVLYGIRKHFDCNSEVSFVECAFCIKGSSLRNKVVFVVICAGGKGLSDFCKNSSTAVDNSDTSVETKQTETSETEEKSGDSSKVEVSNTEQPTVDATTTEADAEPLTTEVPSEPETVTTEPATSPEEQQPTTPEQTPPATSTEVPATEDETPPATDDRGNPADGSPVFEITFNIPLITGNSWRSLRKGERKQKGNMQPLTAVSVKAPLLIWKFPLM